MKTLIHLITWHLRRDIFLATTLVILALASGAIPFIEFPQQVNEGVVVVSSMLYLGMAAMFTTRLVHGQPHGNPDSFWLSRPFSRKTQILAQYITCLVVLALPVLISFLVQSYWLGGSLFDPMLFFVFLLAQMTIIFAAAILTRNVFFTAILVFLAVMIIVFSIGLIQTNEISGRRFKDYTIFVSFPLCAIAAMLLCLSSQRGIWKVRIGFLLCALIVPLIGFSLKKDIFKLMAAPDVSDARFSIQKDVTEMKDPVSYFGFTQITSKVDEPYLIPKAAEFQTDEFSYFMRYHEQLKRPEHKGLFIDRVLSTFPKEAVIYSNSSPYSYYISHPFQDISATNSNGHGAWPISMEVKTQAKGVIVTDAYSFSHIELDALENGASAKSDGVRVKIEDVEKNNEGVQLKLRVSQLDNAPNITKKHTIVVVLFCPQTGLGVSSHPHIFYMHGMQSLVSRYGIEDITMPALASIAPEGEPVQCHVFLSKKLSENIVKELTVEPGSYYVEYQKESKSDQGNLSDISNDEEFENAFIESLSTLTDKGHKLESERRKSLYTRKSGQLVSLMERLIAEKIPLTVLQNSLRDNRMGGKLPMNFLLKYAEKHPVLFNAIRIKKWEGRNQAIPLAVTLLKKANSQNMPQLTPIVTIAAESNDPKLVPDLLKQFPLLRSGHEEVYNRLVKFVPKSELKPLVDEVWKRANADFISPHSISPVASLHGKRKAFIYLVNTMEATKSKHRPNSAQLRRLKKQLSLSEEQASWPNAKLASWISQEARHFKYDPEAMKWGL